MNFNKIGIIEVDGERMGFKPLEMELSMGGNTMVRGELFDIFLNSNVIGKWYPSIENVIFNNPATIVIWSDGTKTVVKCQEGDTYSKELGLAMCISKKFLGNKSNFNEEFRKWIPEEETPSESILVQEMRDRLDDYCIFEICKDCKLINTNCRCGTGVHFKTIDSRGTYTMSDDEIRDAYKKVFG